MKAMTRIAGALLLFASATMVEAACLSGMQAALIAGGFTGPLVCAAKDASFVLVGRTTGRRKYSIYDYRYRYLPPQGAVMHGGQKIVVFEKNKYVGQYALTPPPYVAATVRGTLLTLTAEDGSKAKIDLSQGPPMSIYFDGETEHFYR